MEYLFLPEMQANVPGYADMLECLRRGSPVLYDSARAMLIHEQDGVCILGASDVEEAKAALARLPQSTRMIVVRDRRIRDYAIATLGFADSSECVQVYYDSARAPRPAGGKLEIRHPSASDWAAVRDAYDLITEEKLHEHFVSDDFFCGYYRGDLVGFAGLHTEGALGMLYVFPAYRRRGFAEELSDFMVNRQLSLGRYAYAHVFIDNEASIALQRKTNMTFADWHIFWIWKDAFY